MSGYGLAKADANTKDQVNSPEVVCSQDTQGDQAKGQTAMENCLQKEPGINLVYTINELAAFGAYTALKAAGRAHRLGGRWLRGRAGHRQHARLQGESDDVGVGGAACPGERSGV